MPEFRLNDDSTLEELQQFAERCDAARLHAGRFLARAFQLHQGYRRLDSPATAYAKAEWLVLAWEEAGNAMRAAHNDRHGGADRESARPLFEACSAFYDRYAEWCEDEMLSLLNQVHDRRLGMLKKAKGAPRQATVAKKAIEELGRIEPYPVPPRVRVKWRKMVSYWGDQLALCEAGAYETQ
jgi:hypothetical protein